MKLKPFVSTGNSVAFKAVPPHHDILVDQAGCHSIAIQDGVRKVKDVDPPSDNAADH